MRRVKLIFDCLYCGRKGISVHELETPLPDEELRKRVDHNAVCNNPICPERGQKQEAMFPRIEAA